MKFKFIGCGSAFSTQEYYQSNIILEANSGKKMLIDCGTDARFSTQEAGVSIDEIDAVYISHLHADHVGGMEWLAYCTYFNPQLQRPKLYCVDTLMSEMWEQTLRGGLESIQGKMVTLTEFFDCKPVAINDSFIWEGIKFTPVQSVHIMAGMKIKHSYGLLIDDGNKVVFFTSDTQFCPNQIQDFYNKAELIFQDCETYPFKSGVHAHYDDLKTLSDDTKEKMWLYHYNPVHPQFDNADSEDSYLDGFAGYITKGQEFNI